MKLDPCLRELEMMKKEERVRVFDQNGDARLKEMKRKRKEEEEEKNSP